MATFQAKMFEQLKDLETGCVAYGIENLEQCKQTYYLKQQSEILNKQIDNQQVQQEINQIKTEYKVLQQEVKTIKTQQAESKQSEGFFGSISLYYVFIFVAVVVVAVFATKYFIKNS